MMLIRDGINSICALQQSNNGGERRAAELRRLRSIPPDARRLIRRTPKLDRKAVAMLLDSGLSVGAIQDAVALLGRKLPGSFDATVNDWHDSPGEAALPGIWLCSSGHEQVCDFAHQRAAQSAASEGQRLQDHGMGVTTTQDDRELRAHLEEFLALDIPRLGRRKQIVPNACSVETTAATPPTEKQRHEAIDKRRRRKLRHPNEADIARRAAANAMMKRHWSTPIGITAKFRVYIGAR